MLLISKTKSRHKEQESLLLFNVIIADNYIVYIIPQIPQMNTFCIQWKATTSVLVYYCTIAQYYCLVIIQYHSDSITTNTIVMQLIVRQLVLTQLIMIQFH